MPPKKTRRRTLNQALPPYDAPSGNVPLEALRGLAQPVESQTETVTVRFTGQFLTIWQSLKAQHPGVSPSELVRQAIIVRLALDMKDDAGNLVPYMAEVTLHGKQERINLAQFLGIPPA